MAEGAHNSQSAPIYLFYIGSCDSVSGCSLMHFFSSKELDERLLLVVSCLSPNNSQLTTIRV